MPVPPLSRRSLLCSVAALAPLPHVVTSAQAANSAANKNSRLGIGAIGLRYQGSVIANKASIYGDVNLDRPPRVGKLDAIVNHMRNFFDCVASRCSPVSDVVSQHRSASTCHLGNISMRLGRPLQWDDAQEQFIDDREADSWLKREQRSGFETV